MSIEIIQHLPEGLALALAALPDTHKERAIRYLGKLIEPIGKQSDSQKLLKDLRDKRFRSVYEQRSLNNLTFINIVPNSMFISVCSSFRHENAISVQTACLFFPIVQVLFDEMSYA